MLVPLHFLEGYPLCAFGYREQGADVVGGEQPHRHPHEEPHRQAGHHQGYRHCRPPVIERFFQGSFVKPEHPVEKPLHEVVEPAVLLFRHGPKEPAAQHRCEGKGNDARNQDGDGDGDGKLVKHPPEHAGHEQHRYEDGDERDGHGNDGEADFLRSSIGRLHRRLTLLHVTDDVLQHDDCVVHHETDGEGQCHQGYVVDRKIENIHGRKGADDGQGQRQTGDDGRRHVAQEQEDDHDDQCNGEHQRELHVGHRFADHLGAVEQRVQLDGGG